MSIKGLTGLNNKISPLSTAQRRRRKIDETVALARESGWEVGESVVEDGVIAVVCTKDDEFVTVEFRRNRKTFGWGFHAVVNGTGNKAWTWRETQELITQAEEPVA